MRTTVWYLLIKVEGMNCGMQENYSQNSHAWYHQEFNGKPYNAHAFKISKSGRDEILENGRFIGNFLC